MSTGDFDFRVPVLWHTLHEVNGKQSADTCSRDISKINCKSKGGPCDIDGAEVWIDCVVKEAVVNEVSSNYGILGNLIC